MSVVLIRKKMNKGGWKMYSRFTEIQIVFDAHYCKFLYTSVNMYACTYFLVVVMVMWGCAVTRNFTDLSLLRLHIFFVTERAFIPHWVNFVILFVFNSNVCNSNDLMLCLEKETKKKICLARASNFGSNIARVNKVNKNETHVYCT